MIVVATGRRPAFRCRNRGGLGDYKQSIFWACQKHGFLAGFEKGLLRFTSSHKYRHFIHFVFLVLGKFWSKTASKKISCQTYRGLQIGNSLLINWLQIMKNIKLKTQAEGEDAGLEKKQNIEHPPAVAGDAMAGKTANTEQQIREGEEARTRTSTNTEPRHPMSGREAEAEGGVQDVVMKKARGDAKWNHLSTKQREALEQWLFEDKFTYEATLEKAARNWASKARCPACAGFMDVLPRNGCCGVWYSRRNR